MQHRSLEAARVSTRRPVFVTDWNRTQRAHFLRHHRPTNLLTQGGGEYLYKNKFYTRCVISYFSLIKQQQRFDRSTISCA